MKMSHRHSGSSRSSSSSHKSRRSRTNSPRRSCSRSRDRKRDRNWRDQSRERDYRDQSRDRDWRDQDVSRSRSRSRDRSRRHHSPAPKRKEKERSRSPFSRRRSPTGLKPSSKVILTSLPNFADKDVLNIILARQGFHPIDIRVVRRNTDSGSMRIFGFVEFTDISTAESWINYNQGFLKLDDGYQVRLEYSREEANRERPVYNPLLSDWTCSKCTINNFNRRTSCFKCGTSRKDSEALDAKGYAMVGVSQCDTLLIRELPSTTSEENIRSSLSRYTGLTIQRIQLASSRLYAFAQMKSVEEAGYMLQTFNKVVPYVDNCAVIITYCRQSLNQILIMENVNLLKSQSGISSASIQEDPTNSAAQLAQNAIQIAQMGRAVPSAVPPIVPVETPTRQSISTPFGYLLTYHTPDPTKFQFESSSGYYYDSTTGFYYDTRTGYYYNSNTSQWMFWCSKLSTYIDCEGGDTDLKKKMQEEERRAQQVSQSAVISAPPCAAVAQEQEESTEMQKVNAETRSTSQFEEQQMADTGEQKEKKKKKRKPDEGTEDSKEKTPQDIQREMMKWARRQERIKMSFKQPEAELVNTTPAVAKGRGDSRSALGSSGGKELALEQIKKPWEDDDDDPEGSTAPPESVHKMRGSVTNRQARVRMARAELGSAQHDEQQHSASTDQREKQHNEFDQERFIDRAKRSCLLCRRQFPSMDTLDKHVQMSQLHKTNVAEKLRELQGGVESGDGIAQQQQQMHYRDRAKERRQQYGYDPGLNEVSSGRSEEASAANIEVAARVRASVPLDETNIGNKMLKSMGWSEGKGLGRNLQGIKDPIKAEQHVQGVGLGAAGSRFDPNVTWKDRNRQAAIQRFRDLRDET